jgi:hypothetical protein
VSTAGQVLGRDDAAAKVVADVERRSDAAARTHPEFRGKRGAMAMYYEGYWVYGPTDPRMRLLDALGFTIPPEYAEVTKGKYAVEISPERADMLDVDALVWLNTGGRPEAGGCRPCLYGDAGQHAGPRDRHGRRPLQGDRLRLAAEPALHARQARARAVRRRRRRPGDAGRSLA